MPSTVIRSFHYDPGRRELHVQFHSGNRYTYREVPPEIYVRMKASFAKGEFFNDNVRNRFPFVRDHSSEE